MERRGSERDRRAHMLAVAWILVAVGCQTITEEAPTEPSPVSVVEPITIPVIMPAAAPTPAPGPNPAPTPTPEPEPDPPPTSGSCTLPPSTPANPTCALNPPKFDDEVEEAIDIVTEKKPELFDFNNKKCGDCYYVKNVDAYVAQVVKELEKMGLCVLWDGEEIAVKGTNARSEQYDIILASSHIRRGPGSYRGDCQPSWF